MKNILITYSNETTRKQAISDAIGSNLAAAEFTIDSVFDYDLVEMEMLNNQSQPTIRINKKDISDYDLVLMYNVRNANLDNASFIAHFCKYRSIPYINSREGNYYCGGKLLQKLIFGQEGINSPAFYYNANFDSYTYEEIVEKLNIPFVAKQSKSSLGKKVIIIRNKEQFEQFKQLTQHDPSDNGMWFFEEFIAHQYTIRAFVTGDTCPVTITVTTESETFRTNKGEATFELNDNKKITQVAVKAAKLVQLEISGVDMIYDADADKYIVLEANKSPGITLAKTEYEPKAIADYIRNMLI